MRKSQAILLVILLAIGGLGGWAFQKSQSVSHYSESKAPELIPDAPAEIVAKFQNMAQESCVCTRNSGDESACWEDFNAATNNPEKVFATACDLGSISGVCFDMNEGEVCVTTKFGVDGVCSANESKAAQEAHSKAYKKFMAENGKKGPRSNLEADAYAAGDQAMEEVVAKLRRGEEVEPSGEGVGCAG